MADRVYKLSPEIRALLQEGGFEDYMHEEGETGVPAEVDEKWTRGYPWTSAGVAQYFCSKCYADMNISLINLAAMIGADFAVQMERSAHARPLEAPTDSLRCLHETTQEKLSAELTAMETDIVAFMEQNSLARDIAELRAVIQGPLPGGSRAVQVGSELHEALANLYAALKVDIYAPTSTHYDFDWTGPVADEILSPFAGLSEQYPPEGAEKKDEGQE